MKPFTVLIILVVILLLVSSASAFVMSPANKTLPLVNGKQAPEPPISIHQIQVDSYSFSPDTVKGTNFAIGTLVITNIGYEPLYGLELKQIGPMIPKSYFMRSPKDAASYLVINPGESRTLKWYNRFLSSTPPGTYAVIYEIKSQTRDGVIYEGLPVLELTKI